MGDAERAMADFNKAVRLDPKDWVAYHDRGLLKRALGSTGSNADLAKAALSSVQARRKMSHALPVSHRRRLVTHVLSRGTRKRWVGAVFEKWPPIFTK
jgi:hypothetical protein